MPSLKSRLFRFILRRLNIRRMFYALDAAKEDSDKFQQIVDKARQNDRPLPPQSLQKSAGYHMIDVGGFPMHLLETGERKKVILFLHGGAYILGINGQYWGLLAKIGRKSNHHIAMFDYPLAPEHDCTTAFNRTAEAYAQLCKQYDPADIVLMGDSAGGGLAAALCMQLHDSGQPLPAALLLIYPWVDVTLSHAESRAIEPKDYILACDGLIACGNLYAGELSPKHPYVSPLFGTLDRLPPTHIFAGTHDILYPQARQFYDKARAAGQEAHFHQYDGSPHGWMMLPLPETDRAIAQIVQILT